MSHRAVFAAIGLTAAIGAAPAQGAAKLNYACKWPVLGTQPVTVDLSSSLPQNVAPGASTPSLPATATLRLGGDTVDGFAATGVKTLSSVTDAQAPGKGTAVRSRASQPDGSGFDVRIPLTIDPSTPGNPPLDPLPLFGTGTVPALTFDVPGVTRLNATELVLNLRALDDFGNPVRGFRTLPAPGEVPEDPEEVPRTDLDGDRDTFNVACQLDAANSTTEFARVVVSQPPSAVTSVQFSNVTQTSADVSWDPSTDPDGTIAEYRVSAGDTSTTTTGTSLKLENLKPDTNYVVRVTAIDNDGAVSPYGGFSSFTTKRVNGDARLDYRCKFPVVGTSTVLVELDTSLPTTAVAGQPTGSTAVRAKIVKPPVFALGPETGPFRLESVTDAEQAGKGTALGIRSTTPAGANVDIRVPLSAPPYESTTPFFGVFEFDATGSVPSLEFETPGTATFDLASFTLNLRAIDGDGNPVAGLVTPPTDVLRNPYADIDGDPATFNVPCVLDSNPRIATTEVTPGTTPGPINYAYDLKGSTQIKTLTKGTLPLSGGIAAQLTLATGAFTADLTLNDTSGRLVAAGFLPVTAKIGFAPSGKTTGTLIDGVLKTNSKVRIKVKEIKLFGAIPLAGGNSCQTRSLSDINLQSTQDEFSPLVGGPIAGTYKISDLNGCGPLNGLVSPLTAGSGNTINLNLTPKS